MVILDLSMSFLLGLLTYVLHVLFKFSESKTRLHKVSIRKAKKYTLKMYIYNNYVRLLMSLIAYIALWILMARIENLSIDLGMMQLNRMTVMYVFSFLAGYTSDSLFRNIINIINNFNNKIFTNK